MNSFLTSIGIKYIVIAYRYEIHFPSSDILASLFIISTKNIKLTEKSKLSTDCFVPNNFVSHLNCIVFFNDKCFQIINFPYF